MIAQRVKCALKAAWSIGFISFTLLTFNCSAQEQDIRVVTEILPPYQVYLDDKQLGGYSVEIVRHLLENSSINQEIEVLPWPRAFHLVSTRKNVLIFSMARTLERENDFHWIGRLHKERYAFYKLKKNKSVKGESQDELKKYSVVVARDSNVDDYVNQQQYNHVEKAATLRQMIVMLYTGRVDLILESESALMSEITKTQFDSAELEMVYDLKEFSSDLFIGMSKNSDPKLVKKVSEAFQRFKSSNAYQEIVIRWQL